jgi:hypothetical protein
MTPEPRNETLQWLLQSGCHDGTMMSRDFGTSGHEACLLVADQVAARATGAPGPAAGDVIRLARPGHPLADGVLPCLVFCHCLSLLGQSPTRRSPRHRHDKMRCSWEYARASQRPLAILTARGVGAADSARAGARLPGSHHKPWELPALACWLAWCGQLAHRRRVQAAVQHGRQREHVQGVGPGGSPRHPGGVGGRIPESTE